MQTIHISTCHETNTSIGGKYIIGVKRMVYEFFGHRCENVLKVDCIVTLFVKRWLGFKRLVPTMCKLKDCTESSAYGRRNSNRQTVDATGCEWND